MKYMQPVNKAKSSSQININQKTFEENFLRLKNQENKIQEKNQRKGVNEIINKYKKDLAKNE